MNTKVLKRFLTGLLITILFANTLLVLPPTTLSQDAGATPDSPGTEVSWKKEHETATDSWSWQSLAWEFGPYPSYAIYLMNGTEITKDNFIPLGEDFRVVIQIQRGVFTGNSTLGGAGIDWHIDVRNATNPQDYLGWANLRMGYINQILAKFLPPGYKNHTFQIESSVFNRTEAALEAPTVKISQMGGGGSNVTMRVRMVSTNLWNSTTPPQSLPAQGVTAYTPGVKTGDWANYTMTVYLSDPTAPYPGPGNGTVRIEVRSVVGSNVSFGITFTDAKGTRTTGHWLDVRTGAISDDMAAQAFIASNLTQGDPIYVGKRNLTSTVEKTFAGAQRLINYLGQDTSWDRSTGIIVSQNETTPLGGPPEPGVGPGYGPSGPRSKSFYIWNKALSKFNETAAGWTIEIVGEFNASITPVGPYGVRLEVFDSEGSRIDVGYLAWEGTKSPFRMIAVGRPGLTYGGFDEFWTFEKLDMENHIVYSVARGQPWIMRVNVTSPNLANVTLAFQLDDNIKTFVNVTNWHPETRTGYGGWMYNASSGTYYWNSSVPVTRTEQVYGPTLEERWLWVPHQRQVNVTRSYWNSNTSRNELVTVEETIWGEKMFLIYDHTTRNFSVMQGYSYWAYDETVGHDRETKVLRPLNTSDLTTRFYGLNVNRSRAYQTGPNKWTIEFIGTFSNETYSSRDQYWVNPPSVYRTDGREIWADWESVDWSAFEVAVDKMVAITKIFDGSGREVKMWMFRTDPGKPFIIQSVLQGAKKLYTDIDAVGVRLFSGEGRWAPTESFWSNVEVKLIYNKYEGTLDSTTYNRTERSIYVFGPYKTWVEVNQTGYHNEYNMSSGIWEWVNGTYTEWNYTTVTDWHWAYYSLNQTEYARNASSPNIWIDRSERWISWEDPAFKVPTSYASLNSANMTLKEGLVIANLNVTFNNNAPRARYWWEITFGNRTFGPDWSQGWGEHKVTDWTKSSIYSVNSSATGGNKWYIEIPSQPYYTIYSGTKQRVYETPYIVIGANVTAGTKYFLKARTTYDFWSGTERTEYLLRDPWDPIKQRELRYYELLNGTRLYVDQGHRVIIRDIKLNTTEAYKFGATGARVYLPNQTIFSTFMDHSQEDWGMSYWNQTLMRHVVPTFYELIDGTKVYSEEGFETRSWNTTTNRWDLTEKRYAENATSLTVDLAGRGVFLNGTILVPLRDQGSWWQPLPSGAGYYLIMKNGTRIVHRNPWMYDDRNRIVTISGVNYSIGWPIEYYTGTYQSHTIIAKGGWEGFVRDYYYTTVGGTKYEMPYPEALASSWWDLENPQSAGGKILTGKSIVLSGVRYPIYRNGTNYYVVRSGLSQPVSKPLKDLASYYSLINGMEFWNITQGGWSASFGRYNNRIGQIELAGSLTTTTGYDADARRWQDWNKYGEDRENSTRYLVNMLSGQRIDVYEGRYLNVWNVSIGGKFYLTLDAWDRGEMVQTEKGDDVWRQYIRTLNGTKVYFDWGMNPANWVEEIHVELPGTNYTRLVPYEWENQTYLDKTYVYNITITDNTGIWYQNRTKQVPNGTRFYVWGTRYGPGIRVGHSWDRTQEWVWGLPREGDFSYLETIQGERIYSNRSRYAPFYRPDFGWYHPEQRYRFEQPGWVQWSGTSTTLNAIEGGRFIRLISNATHAESILETTETGWQYESWLNPYVILANGSRLDFTYEGSNWIEGRYVDRSAVIGDELYWSDSFLGTYYNITYGSAIYHLNDEAYLVATTQLVPVPKFGDPSMPVKWMNATSDKILRDGSGYFLINASSQNRLNLDSVSRWWGSRSEKVRSELFQGWDVPWELRNIYPRYNATVNGVEFFVIDPSPTPGYWNPGSTWEHTRYSSNFTLSGRSYPIDYNAWDRYSWRAYNAIVVNGTKYELQDQWQWKAIYTVPFGGRNNEITIADENVYKEHTTWGPAYKWMLTDMGVYTLKTVYDIVVGAPKYGMWGVRSFTTVPESGAVDLDGDLATTSDQYFVRRIHGGSDTWNRTEDRMWVELVWDPNATQFGDEMHIGAWMGKVYTKWSFTWNETYIWYYASNMSTVSPETMSRINATLIDSETGMPNAGYWEIARMAQNTTWEDLQRKAQAEGWDWFTDNTNEWEWMWFGARQDYRTAWTEDGVMKSAGIGLEYQYGGLLLYNDTNSDTIMQNTETTHFFMPSRIGSITLTSPGEALGNYNETGTMTLNLTDRVDFGVKFTQVNGTLFPYDPSRPRAMWGWWDSFVYGADFGVPNFMDKPTESSVDNIQFNVHFNASVTGGNATNNEATMKIDERFGKWSIDPNVIDGRTKQLTGNVSTYLKGREVFQKRSMAASWFVTAYTNEAWDVKDEMGEAISPENVTRSTAFDVASAAAKFATFRMGGTYDWKKPIATNDTIRTLNVSSYTTPIGTFRSSYVSDAGKSSTSFDITATTYFLTVGFPKWDGYGVYHDPQMSAYTAKFAEVLPQRPPTSISLQLSKSSITKGESVTISGAINASVSAEVTIQTSTDGGATWSNLTKVTTTSTGSYSYIWTPTTAGSYKVRATWSGNNDYLGATSSAASLTVSEPGKQATTITSQLSKTSITKGDSVTISGAISAQVSAPVTIQVSTDNGATWSDLATVTSTSDGAYTYTWTPTTVGTYKVRAEWAGNDQYLGATSSEATLTVALPSSQISMQLSKTSITRGESVTISGAISPAVSAQVTIQISTDGGTTWSDLTKVTSSSDGSYTYMWTPQSAGTYSVRAVWSGNSQYQGATSPVRTLTVSEAVQPADYTIYIVVAVVILVVAAAGAFFMLRKRAPQP